MNIIDDLETEYKNFLVECKKKFANTREGIETSLKLLTQFRNLPENQIEGEIKNSIDVFLKPILHSSETKHTKLYSCVLLIVKKIVVYNLIKHTHLTSIIQILREVLDSSSDEFIQIKVLETLLLMLNPQNIYLTDNLVINVLMICFKMFGHKSFNIKNTVSALLKQLVTITYDFLDKLLRPAIEKKLKENAGIIEGNNPEIVPENLVVVEDKEEFYEPKNGDNTNEFELKDNQSPANNEVIIEENKETNEIEKIEKPKTIDLEEFTSVEIYQISLKMFKDLILIAEGKKKEWIASSIYSKCLGLELLSCIISSSREIMRYLPEFLELVKNDLYKFIKKNFDSTNDYIMGLKLCRISIQITENLNICYDLIQNMVKYAETQNFNSWKKLLGLECLSSICNNNILIQGLFSQSQIDSEKSHNIYLEFISTLTKVSYSVINSKSTEITKKQEVKKNEKSKSQKYIELSSILTEHDVINAPQLTIQHAFKLITESYNFLLESYIIILDLNNIKLNKINKQLETSQEKCKEMISISSENIKNAFTVLLINSTEDPITQTYLNLYQNFINICGSINLSAPKESFLNDLCKLAIPNNLENSYEMKEKNVLISKSLFNISHGLVQILDFGTWLILIETMQKIYLVLVNTSNYFIKQTDEFDIDLVLYNLESNIKKYNPDFQVSECYDTRNLKKPIEDHLEKDIISGNLDEYKETGIETNPNQKKKGILSSIKNIFSANKNENTKFMTSPNKKGEDPDLQILSAAIDSLFINSTYYEKEIIYDIFKSIYESTKNLIEKNDVINDNINVYLHFNITKLLELAVINVKRINVFWDILLNMVLFISGKNLPFISKFSLEALTVIFIFALKQFVAIEEEDWSHKKWQNTLFSTYKSIATSNISPEINLIVLACMQKIIQNCSGLLDSWGWSNFIEICQILMVNSDDSFTTKTFEMISSIIHEHVDYLSVYNINSIMNVLEIFSTHKGDINNCFTALSMNWNIANLIEKFDKLTLKSKDEINNLENLTKFQKEFFFVEQNLDEFMKNLWISFFNKLINISNDLRFEVRKSAILTFGDIFVAKNSLISNEIGISIINSIFITILEKSYGTFEDKIRINRAKRHESKERKEETKQNELGGTVDFKVGDFKIDQLKLPERKTKEEDSINRYPVLNPQEKEWEESNIVVIQAIGKIVKSFMTTTHNKTLENQFFRDSFLNILIEKFTRIMRLTSTELAISVLKCIQEVYYCRPEIYLLNFTTIWQIFEELGKFITSDFFVHNFCSIQNGGRLTNTIIEIFKEIFTKDENLKMREDLLSGVILENLISFSSFLLKSARNSENQNALNNPQRLLGDERTVFDFIEKISKNIKTTESSEIYCRSILKYLRFDSSEPHSEAHCRKILELLESFIFNFAHNRDFLRKNIPKVLFEVKDLICLRNKNEYVTVLIKNNKSPMQLWHFAAGQMIKLLDVLLCKGQREISGEDQDSIPRKIEIIETLEDNLNEVWDSAIQCFETIFKQSEGGYKSISRNLIDELMKSCQEMEIQIINFIVNSLLPNSLRIPKEMQLKLLTLLDLGCNFDYITSNTNNQNQGASSISRVCISNLFDICKFRSEENLRKSLMTEDISSSAEDYIKIKIKIAKMSTPILIKRCRETLKKFLDDEVKSGTMPLPRSRYEDMKYVLDKMKNLEVYPNYLNVDDEGFNGVNNNVMDIVMKNKKSHLFTLLPLLSEFITTREHDIKLIVKEIFKLVTQEMGLK